MRLLRTRGSAELGKVASGSATQSLWLRDRKVRFQAIGEDRSRFPGRGKVREVRREERRASNRAKERVYRFRVRFGREKIASRLPCLSLGLGDDRRSASGSGDVSLAIVIISVSGSENLASFTNRILHFSGPPGFRMTFGATERNGKFGCIQRQRSEESSSTEKRRRRVFLSRRTVKVKVRSKVIPASFLKIEGRETLVGAKDRRERGTDRKIGR